MAVSLFLLHRYTDIYVEMRENAREGSEIRTLCMYLRCVLVASEEAQHAAKYACIAMW